MLIACWCPCILQTIKDFPEHPEFIASVSNFHNTILKSSLHEINLSQSLLVNFSYLFLEISDLTLVLNSSIWKISYFETKFVVSKYEDFNTHSLEIDKWFTQWACPFNCTKHAPVIGFQILIIISFDPEINRSDPDHTMHETTLRCPDKVICLFKPIISHTIIDLSFEHVAMNLHSLS